MHNVASRLVLYYLSTFLFIAHHSPILAKCLTRLYIVVNYVLPIDFAIQAVQLPEVDSYMSILCKLWTVHSALQVSGSRKAVSQ